MSAPSASDVSNQNWSGNSWTRRSVRASKVYVPPAKKSRWKTSNVASKANAPMTPTASTPTASTTAPPRTARQNRADPRARMLPTRSTTSDAAASRARPTKTRRTSIMWARSRAFRTGWPATTTSKFGGPTTRSDRIAPVACWSCAGKYAAAALAAGLEHQLVLVLPDSGQVQHQRLVPPGEDVVGCRVHLIGQVLATGRCLGHLEEQPGGEDALGLEALEVDGLDPGQ